MYKFVTLTVLSFVLGGFQDPDAGARTAEMPENVPCLIFDGVGIDFETEPFEIFGEKRPGRVLTVAGKAEAVRRFEPKDENYLKQRI